MEEGERQKSADAYNKDTAEANTFSPEQGGASRIRRKANHASSASRARRPNGGGSVLTTPPTTEILRRGDVFLN